MINNGNANDNIHSSSKRKTNVMQLQTTYKSANLYKATNCYYLNNVEHDAGKIDVVINPKHIKNISFLLSSTEGTPVTFNGYIMDGDRGPKFIARSMTIDEDSRTGIEIRHSVIRDAAAPVEKPTLHLPETTLIERTPEPVQPTLSDFVTEMVQLRTKYNDIIPPDLNEQYLMLMKLFFHALKGNN